MPLHEREQVSERLTGCVYAGRDLTGPASRCQFPRGETLARDAPQLVCGEPMPGGNARQNLAAFCR